MGYKILNLDMPTFVAVCGQLQECVEKSGFRPDVIIPVPRGGNRVATYLFSGTKAASVKLVRPPKGALKRSLATLLRILPGFMLDAMRIAEAKILVRRTHHMQNTSVILPELSPDMHNVLIVDDAIDSGATLKAIIAEFEKKYSDCNIKSAVITVTSPKAVYKPDYCIFDNRTLIRTPWSIDMRQKKQKH